MLAIKGWGVFDPDNPRTSADDRTIVQSAGLSPGAQVFQPILQGPGVQRARGRVGLGAGMFGLFCETG